MAEMTDVQIREELLAIDNSDDIDVTQWEAGYIDSVAYKWTGKLSEKQRATALKIIEKYEGRY